MFYCLVHILLQLIDPRSVLVPSFLSSPTICIAPILSTNLFVGPLIITPLRFGDTSRVSLNENPCDAVVEVLSVSSGGDSDVDVGGGDGGVHKGSSGLVVQSTLHNISSGFLVQSSGSGSVDGPSVSSDVGKLLFALLLLLSLR